MIEILILIILVSYREVGILCDRGSWQWSRFQRVFWKTNQAKFWVKNYDWFHVSNGLVTLLICWVLSDHYQLIDNRFVDTPIYWLIWMWLRNIVMHVILPMPDARRYWFIMPLIGGYIESKLRKK